MGLIQPCKDLTEAIEMCESLGFFLKPIAKLNICVQLPLLKMPGKSISNWEVMEKLKKIIHPEEFSVLKVTKTTLEFLRFEAEVANKSSLKTVISRLDSSTIKLNGFPDSLKVRSAEAKVVFPTRHDWESYFRDAKHMDEMKPGERPDTICVQYLPTKWFADARRKDGKEPSEHMVRQVFESFGSVRRVDIPKPSAEKDGGSSIQTFSFGQDLSFEAFVQYKEYMGFVKAMDALRGMKLMYKAPDGKSYVTDIKVDFDRTKHLSEKNIAKRMQEELIPEEHSKSEEATRKSKTGDLNIRDKPGDRSVKDAACSSKRPEEVSSGRYKSERHCSLDAAEESRKRTKVEQRCKVLKSRKRQSLLLLDELMERIKVRKEEEMVRKHLEEIERERLKQMELENRRKLEELRRREQEEREKREKLLRREKVLRERLLKSLKMREEKRSEELREKLRKEIAGKHVLKSVLVPVTNKDQSQRLLSSQRQRTAC